MKKTMLLNIYKIGIVVFGLAVGLPLMAADTGQINYQARLLDSYGRRVNTTVDLSFKIYDAVTDGNLLWSETQAGVVVQDGVYSVVLGSQTAIPASVFSQNTVYLELGISGETMSPRQQITATAYSLVARTIMGSNVYENQDSGYVGVGTTNPAVKLDVSGTIQATGIKIPTGATANYVLASDASGVGTWQPYSAVVTEHDPIFTNWVTMTFTPATNNIWGAINLRALSSDVSAATNDMWDNTAAGINARVLATTYSGATNALWSNLRTATNDMWDNGINVRVLRAGDKMTGLLTNLVGFVGNGAGLTGITAEGVSLTGVVHRIGGPGSEMTGPLVISNSLTVTSNVTVTLTNEAGYFVATNSIYLGGTTITNWLQVGSTANVAELQGKTSAWNTAVIDSSSATGNVAELQGKTSAWNTAVIDSSSATGNVAVLQTGKVDRVGDIMSGTLTNLTNVVVMGSVGIGTAANPSYSLDVTGIIHLPTDVSIRAGSMYLAGSADFGVIQWSGSTKMSVSSLGVYIGGSVYPRNMLDVSGAIAVGSYAGTTLPAAAANGMAISGNVGIGTNDPGAKLEIVQSAHSSGIKITGYDTSSDSSGFLYITINDDFYIAGTAAKNMTVGDSSGQLYLRTSGSIRIPDNNMIFSDERAAQFGNSTDYSIGYNDASDTLQFVDGGTIGANVKMVINNQGNVGIGTNNPVAPLHVGTTNAAGVSAILQGSLVVDNISTITTARATTWDNVAVLQTGKVDKVGDTMSGTLTNLTNVVVMGSVGIGTAGLNDKLTISDSSPSSTTYGGKKLSFYTRRAGGGLTGDMLGQILFDTTRADQDSGYPGAAIGAVLELNVINYAAPASLRFYTSNGEIGDGLASGAQGERMRITPSGNVGIGTNDPQARLHVNGSAIIETNLTVNGIISNSDAIKWNNAVVMRQGTAGTEVSTFAYSNLYYFAAGNTWSNACATNSTTARGLLGLALGNGVGAAIPSAGLLLNGYCTNALWGFTNGAILYLATNANGITQIRPTGTNQFVRIVGYAISDTNIYFNPDRTYIEILGE